MPGFSKIGQARGSAASPNDVLAWRAMSLTARPHPKPAQPSGLRAFEPELLFVDGAFRANAALVVNPDGSIHSIGQPPEGSERIRLPNAALLPGLVNGHSHAFQRVIRGRTEHRAPGHESDDFWSWREAMYSAALELTPDDVHVAARMAFLEMALSGITHVGEFHYLHNDRDGGAYADPNALAHAVISAASAVGIRITLLRVAYQQGGFDQPPGPRQRRFIESTEAFVRNTEALRGSTLMAESHGRATVGVAPHSVRAVGPDALRELAAWAKAQQLPVHLHASEQPAEIGACLDATGRRPVEHLASLDVLGERTTLVHAIHLSDDEIELISRSGTTVCACPTTERNLGDGIVPADRLLGAGVPVSLGSDSQATIDLLEDARELDYHLRLERLERAVLLPPGKRLDRSGLARRLFACATEAGARSLASDGGTLAPGKPADFFTVALEDPSIAGCSADDLLPAIVFGLARTAVRDVFVAGEQIVHGGHVEGLQRMIVKDFAALQKRLWGEA